MNLKFLIVLTMVLCAFCVLPVNAENIEINENPTISYDNTGVHKFNSRSADYQGQTGFLDQVTLIGQRDNFKNVNYMYYHSQSNNAGQRPYNYMYNLPSNVFGNPLNIEFVGIGEGTVTFYESEIVIYINEWDSSNLDDNATVHIIPIKIFDTVNQRYIVPSYGAFGGVSDITSTGTQIGNTDSYIIFGHTEYLNQGLQYSNSIMIGKNPTTTYVSSSSEWNIEIYGNYNTNYGNIHLTYDNAGGYQYNTVIKTVNNNLLYSYNGADDLKIVDITNPSLSPIILEITGLDQTFTYVYPESANSLQGIIQYYDNDNGNMLSGVNISVYEVIDFGTYAELGNLTYSNRNTDSQTIFGIKYNTEYFVKNELNGYVSVKNQEYSYFNNEYGYWWIPSLNNPLRLYYTKKNEYGQYDLTVLVQNADYQSLSGVSVTMDNSITKITNNIGSCIFQNVSVGSHSFTFVKNGYQSAQRNFNVISQYGMLQQILYADNQIIQPTVQPSAYPTIQPTVQPTISPIDKPTNLAESVKYGLAKMFGVNSLNTINLIFALMIILFPAVVAGVITNQALGFIAGGLIGFVFALGIGLIPLWVFFSMIMLSVIYLVMTHSESGF